MRERHPPVVHTEWVRDEPRKVQWIELFYDLVYVAAVIQLGDQLSDDVSWRGFGHFAVLLAALWWTWTGTTAYFNRFLVDDNLHRALVVAQMVAVANLAINAPEAFTDGASLGVAWWFVVVRTILLLLHARAYRHCPSARPLLVRWLQWEAAGLAVFLVAPFVAADARMWVWLVGVVVSSVGSLSPGGARLERDLPADDEHLAERYALFTLIVLGESFVKTVTGLADEGVSLGDEILGGMGFFVIVALWWTYFDLVAEAGVPAPFWRAKGWSVLHLPLVLAITALGVGTKKIALSEVGQATSLPYAVLFGGSAALAMAAVAAILVLQGQRRAGALRLAAAGGLALLVVLGGERLPVGLYALAVAGGIALPHLFDRESPDAVPSGGDGGGG